MSDDDRDTDGREPTSVKLAASSSALELAAARALVKAAREVFLT